MSRNNEPEFTEKTHNPKCVDPDYHILGGFDGALQWMKMADKEEMQQKFLASAKRHFITSRMGQFCPLTILPSGKVKRGNNEA